MSKVYFEVCNLCSYIDNGDQVLNRLFEGQNFYTHVLSEYPDKHPGKNSIGEVSNWLEQKGYDSLFKREVYSLDEKAERYRVYYEKSEIEEEPLSDLLERIKSSENLKELNLDNKLLMAMMFDTVELQPESIVEWLEMYI